MVPLVVKHIISVNTHYLSKYSPETTQSIAFNHLLYRKNHFSNSVISAALICPCNVITKMLKTLDMLGIKTVKSCKASF